MHFSFLTIFLILLDQATKHLAKAYVISEPFEITSFFSLTYAENTGIAWSLPVPEPILLTIIPVILIGGIYFAPKYFNFKHPTTQLIAASILAGALSNYFDRLIYGYVIDFISIGWWPIFNLADVYITCAAFLIMVFHAKIERT